MKPARFIFLGGLLAALAVGLGAIGAHALKTRLAPQQLETFHIAVHYQMIHAIGLILVGGTALIVGWLLLAFGCTTATVVGQ